MSGKEIVFILSSFKGSRVNECNFALNIPTVPFLLFSLPDPVCWDAAMNPVIVTHGSIVMGDTLANSVFPQTVFPRSMTYRLTMFVVISAEYFVADCGLKMGMRKVGC